MRKCRKCKAELPTAKLSNDWERKGFCGKDCAFSYKPTPKAGTKPKAKKLKTIAKLHDEAAVLCQRMVKLKAADDDGMCVCWSCGRPGHWSEMQGGHFIERRRTATRCEETNIHPQHAGCNLWEMKNTTTVLAYRQTMVDYYGQDYVEELLRRSKQVFKPTREWIAQQAEYFTQQIAYHEKRLNVR